MNSAFQKRWSNSVGVPAANSTGECKVLITPQRILQLAVFSHVFNQSNILVLSNSEWNHVSNIACCYELLTNQTLENLLQLLRGPTCESSRDWVFLINLVVGEWLRWMSAGLWYLLGSVASVVSLHAEALQIISKIHGPIAVALLETERSGGG